MTAKEGRDFISLEECVCSVNFDGSIKLSSIDTTFTLSKKEFEKLVSFAKQKLAQQSQKG